MRSKLIMSDTDSFIPNISVLGFTWLYLDQLFHTKMSFPSVLCVWVVEG